MAYATPDNVSSLSTLFQYSNQVTNDTFGIVVSILIFVVFFMVFARYGGLRSFAISSFITAISTIMLRVINVVSDYVVIFSVIFVIFSVIALILAGRE